MKKIILMLTIFYLPFQFKIYQYLPFPIMNVLLLCMLAFLVSSRNKDFRRPAFEAPLIWFLLAWFASFVFACFFTDGMPLWDIAQEFKRLYTMPIFYFVFSRCIKTRKDLNFYLKVFLVVFVLVGFHTYRNGVLGGSSFGDQKRSSGPFGESWHASDIAGGYLATLIPFLFAYFLFEKKKILKFLSAIGVGICLFGLLATYSRGSMMAALASLVLLLLFSLPSLLKRSKIYGLLVVLVLGCGLASWRLWMPEATITRFADTVQSDKLGSYSTSESLDESSQMRLSYWKAVFPLFQERPLTGIGFRQVQFQLGHDPHNAFLQTLTEMGIFGFAIFVWFLLSVFREGWKMMRTEIPSIGAGLLGFVISFTFVNAFYANFYRDAVAGSIWIALGICAAGISLVKNEVTVSKENRSQCKRKVVGG